MVVDEFNVTVKPSQIVTGPKGVIESNGPFSKARLINIFSPLIPFTNDFSKVETETIEGVQNGFMRIYDRNGKLIKEVYFKDGLQVKI